MNSLRQFSVRSFKTVNVQYGCSLEPPKQPKPKQLNILHEIHNTIYGGFHHGGFHLVGIGQTHWMGEGFFYLYDGPKRCLVVHCGESDTAYRGVAIVLSPLMETALHSADFVSNRIVSVNLMLSAENGFWMTTTVVQVYAPRRNNVKIEHDKFWKQLEYFLRIKFGSDARIGSKYVLIMGDFDADIEAVYSEFEHLTIDNDCNKFYKPSIIGSNKNFFILLQRAEYSFVQHTYVEGFLMNVVSSYRLWLWQIANSQWQCNEPIDEYLSKTYFKLPTSSEYHLAGEEKSLFLPNNQPAATCISIYAPSRFQYACEKLTNSVEIMRYIQYLYSELLAHHYYGPINGNGMDKFSCCLFIDIGCSGAFQCANWPTLGVESIQLRLRSSKFSFSKRSKRFVPSTDGNDSHRVIYSTLEEFLQMEQSILSYAANRGIHVNTVYICFGGMRIFQKNCYYSR